MTLGNTPELAQQVKEACADIESGFEDLGPNLRRGTNIRKEFDCHDGCAFDSEKCRPGTGGYHGCGSRMIAWYVCAPGRGGVSFDLHAPIALPETLARWKPYHTYTTYDDSWSPLGSIDYHIADASEEEVEQHWMSRIEGECVVTTVDHCFCCRGTFLQADVGVEILLAGGSGAVWSWLAEEWLPYAAKMFSKEAR